MEEHLSVNTAGRTIDPQAAAAAINKAFWPIEAQVTKMLIIFCCFSP